MTGWVKSSGDGGDQWRSPHQRAENIDIVAEEIGPAGICEDCGHFACRHSQLRCRFHELDPKKYKPCPCRGMQWSGERSGERYYMDPAHGPIRPATVARGLIG